MRVFENGVLRRIFGPKKGDVTEEWRKLHNEELNVRYSSSSIVRVIKSRIMRRAGHVECMKESKDGYRGLVEKPEGKRPLRKSRHRCEENIKIDFQEVGCEGMDWIDLAQDKDSWRALVNAVMILLVP